MGCEHGDCFKQVNRILGGRVNEVVKAFDYSNYDSHVRLDLMALRDGIKLNLRTMLNGIVSVGGGLHEVRGLLPSDREFDAWRVQETGLDADTAQRVMQMAVIEVNLHFHVIDDINMLSSMMNLLRASTTLDDLEQAVLEQAASGEPVTEEFARRLLLGRA
jgi:hypothetical protein